MIFSTQDGDIALIKISNTEQSEPVKLSHADACNILKVSPSPDSTAYAVLCQGKTQIFIGDLKGSPLTPIDVKFTVQAMSWHPTENKLALAGVNLADENKYHLSVLDVTKPDTPVDYSDAHKLM